MRYEKIECALYVICRSDRQKTELMKRFAEEHPGNGRLFMWNSHKFPNRIDFAFSSGENTSSRDNDILAIAQWLQADFKLKMLGYWYEQDEDTATRREVHDGEITYADLMWLKSCTVAHNEKLRRIAEERFGMDFHKE